MFLLKDAEKKRCSTEVRQMKRILVSRGKS